MNTYTNDLTYKNIRSILNKTIYIVKEIIDIIRLCWVSIKINNVKDKNNIN